MLPIDDGGPAFPQPYPPQAFETAIAFVDGTNVFYSLMAQKLIVRRLYQILVALVRPRKLHRVYLYSTAEHVERAKVWHGDEFLEGCRIVYGDSIPTGDGNVREKGVDALLVADLVYHAASKNCQFALVASHDTDFCHALKRVEDFGCRTAVLAIGTHSPLRLRESADHYIHLSAEQLVNTGFATSKLTEPTTVKAAERGAAGQPATPLSK
jgi:uncharacterized LabA/DUF88 family protein